MRFSPDSTALSEAVAPTSVDGIEFNPSLLHLDGPHLHAKSSVWVTARLEPKAAFDVVKAVLSELKSTSSGEFGVQVTSATGSQRVVVMTRLHRGTVSDRISVTVKSGSGSLSRIEFTRENPRTIYSDYPISDEVEEDVLADLSKALMHRAQPAPPDGLCHAIGFGEDCQLLAGHGDIHVSFPDSRPIAWTRSERVDYHSEQVVGDLYARLRAVERRFELDQARVTRRSTKLGRKSR